MPKYKLRAVVEPNTTLAQDANICVGSDRTGAVFIETSWKIHPWLDNDDDPEQLIYILPSDAKWPDVQDALTKELYAEDCLRVIRVHPKATSVTAYVIAYKPGADSAKP